MDIPNIKDELDRKTLEALEVLLVRRAAEQIDDSQLQVGIDTLFGSVSGMLSRSVVDVVSEVAKIDRPTHEEVRVYFSDLCVQIIKRLVGQGRVIVTERLSNGGLTTFQHAFKDKEEPDRWASAYMTNFESQLFIKGYKRVA